MTKEWESFKSLIVKYYETYPLNQVREIMRNDHGFDASIRSYREKLRKWGVYKYSLNRPKNVGGGGGTSQVEAAGPAESVSSMEVKVDDDAYGEDSHHFQGRSNLFQAPEPATTSLPQNQALIDEENPGFHNNDDNCDDNHRYLPQAPPSLDHHGQQTQTSARRWPYQNKNFLESAACGGSSSSSNENMPGSRREEYPAAATLASSRVDATEITTTASTSQGFEMYPSSTGTIRHYFSSHLPTTAIRGQSQINMPEYRPGDYSSGYGYPQQHQQHYASSKLAREYVPYHGTSPSYRDTYSYQADPLDKVEGSDPPTMGRWMPETYSPPSTFSEERNPHYARSHYN